MLRILPTLAKTLLVATALLCGSAAAAETTPPTLRIGTLAFGTLGWELAVIAQEGLDKQEGFTMTTLPLAGADAGRIALQGKSVDLIVGDWIWVAQQRAQGMDYTFAPYSTNHGALLVPATSPIKGIGDLPGKRLGIAGGGLDKNWLLLRALAAKSGLDLDRSAEKTFAAPPLLSQELQQGKLDALLTYWNYAARLEVLGYRKILDGQAIIKGLGIEAQVPALGYVFRDSWAAAAPGALTGFFRAADRARQKICDSDATWATVAPLTQESDENVRKALRQAYCAGRVTTFGETERKAAGEIYALIAKTGTGTTAPLPAGTFWSAPR